MVSWENYEEYMILHADGELGEAGQKALLDFVNRHPELREELNAYQSAVLVPDNSLVYAGKEALLRPVPAGRVISIRQWRIYSAAAAVLLIVILMAARWMNSGSRTVISPAETAKNEAVQPARQQQAPAPLIQTPVENTPAPVRHQSPSVAANSVHSSPVVPANKAELLSKMEVPAIQPIRTEIAVNTRQQAVTVPELSLPVSELETAEAAPKTGFLSRLRVSEEKKEGLEHLKDNVENKIGQVKNLRENLQETAFAFKLGSKELFVINF